MRVLSGFIWLWKETSGGFFEHRNDPLYFLKAEEFLYQLSDYQLLNEDSAKQN
jgi:hypothetical protein